MKIVRTKESIVARSASFFWWKRVYVGAWFWLLAPETRAAVLAHESYHCHQHHTEWRILALLFPFIIPRLCRRQELEADAFAASFGHGPALYEFLKPGIGGGLFHPSNDVRRDALLHNEFFRMAPVTSQPVAQSA
jgi:hypothetical protein